MLRLRRSPAKVTWQVMYNNVVLASKPTKNEAEELLWGLSSKYGVPKEG